MLRWVASRLRSHSGAIGALSFGILLGNIDLAKRSFLKRFAPLEAVHLNDNERAFYSEIAFIIKTFFFVYVGLVMPLDNMQALLVGLGLTLLIYTLRVPVIRLSMRPEVGRMDASIAAVLVPKGLAAAVLAALPLQMGVANGALLQTVVYAIILFSIILAAVLSFLVSKRLLRQPYAWAFAGYPDEQPGGRPDEEGGEAQPAPLDAQETETTGTNDPLHALHGVGEPDPRWADASLTFVDEGRRHDATIPAETWGGEDD